MADQENENPGAAATASGAEFEATNFRNNEYRERAVSATALCAAIANCHPDDAAILMTGILDRMGAGMPIAPLFNVMDEAGFWADLASEAENKAYCLATYMRMDPANQAAFLSYVCGVAA